MGRFGGRIRSCVDHDPVVATDDRPGRIRGNDNRRIDRSGLAAVSGIKRHGLQLGTRFLRIIIGYRWNQLFYGQRNVESQ